MIVAQPREALWAWLNTRVPAVRWSDDFRAIGLVRNDCLVAVAGYNMFAGLTCHVHIAADGPVSRGFVQAGFKYCFEQLKLVSILAWMDPAEAKPLAIDLKLGFKEVLRIPHGAMSGQDLILIQMNKDDCKWIRKDSLK